MGIQPIIFRFLLAVLMMFNRMEEFIQKKKTDSAAIGFSKTSGKSGIENSDVPPMGDDFNVQDPMGKLTHLTHLTHCYPMVHTLV